MDDDLENEFRAAKPGTVRRHDPIGERGLVLLEEINREARTHTIPPRRLHSPWHAAASRRSRQGSTRARRTVFPLLGGGFVVVMVAITIIAMNVMNPGAAVALTPPLLETTPVAGEPSDVMRELGQADGNNGGTAVDGNKIRFTSWALNTTIGEDGTITSSAVEPQWREVTFAADGTTRMVITAGTPFDGQPTGDLPKPGTLLEDTTYDPGSEEFGFAFREEPPTDPATVGEYLQRAIGLENPSLGDYFLAVGGLLSTRILTGEQESALVVFLSEQNGLRIAGSTTDRLGREGIVFQASGRLTGYQDYLVISRSGQILASETIYTGDERDDIPSPSVVEYTAWER